MHLATTEKEESGGKNKGAFYIQFDWGSAAISSEQVEGVLGHHAAVAAAFPFLHLAAHYQSFVVGDLTWLLRRAFVLRVLN